MKKIKLEMGARIDYLMDNFPGGNPEVKFEKLKGKLLIPETMHFLNFGDHFVNIKTEVEKEGK